MSAEEKNEQTSLIANKPGDEEVGGKDAEEAEGSWMMKKVFWVSVFCLILIGGVLVTTLQLTGGIDPFDDDDGGDDGDDDDDEDGDGDEGAINIVSKRPRYCGLQASVSEGVAVACHDPTGCSGIEDETEWCYVSDGETPVSFAFANIDLLQTVNKESFLAQSGEDLSEMSPTCIINACKNRKCACKDNGNGTSYCPGIKKDTFPFTDISAGNYPNCEAEEEEDPEEAIVEKKHMYQGRPTLCACKDVQGCSSYDGKAPGWSGYNTNITESLTDRCYVSLHHDGTLDSCVPGACGMIFACDCIDHLNGTSSCPTYLPFREIKNVPNCENFQ